MALTLSLSKGDGDERSLEVAGQGQVIEQVRDRADLVGLLGDAHLDENEAGVAGVGAQHVECLEPIAPVVCAPRPLAPHPDPAPRDVSEGARHTLSSNPSRNAITVHNQPRPTAANSGAEHARPHICQEHSANSRQAGSLPG